MPARAVGVGKNRPRFQPKNRRENIQSGFWRMNRCRAGCASGARGKSFGFQHAIGIFAGNWDRLRSTVFRMRYSAPIEQCARNQFSFGKRRAETRKDVSGFRPNRATADPTAADSTAISNGWPAMHQD